MFKKTLLAMTVIASSFVVNAEKIDMKKTSYAVGVQTATLLSDNIQRSSEIGVNIDRDEVLRGVSDALFSNGEITYDQSIVLLKALDKHLAEKEKVLMEGVSGENKQLGKEFMERQALLKNIIKTDSGLQYKIIKNGSGKKPSATSNITVHYKGVLINGEEFDNSYKRGEPATFGLDGVIKGWTEGLQLMSEGSMYEFTIPPELAYGDKGTPNIPPGSTLVFMVELLKVN